MTEDRSQSAGCSAQALGGGGVARAEASDDTLANLIWQCVPPGCSIAGTCAVLVTLPKTVGRGSNIDAARLGFDLQRAASAMSLLRNLLSDHRCC